MRGHHEQWALTEKSPRIWPGSVLVGSVPAWRPREAWLRSHMVLGFPVRGGERCLPSARGAPAAFWSFPVLLGCWGVCVCVRAQPVWVLISSRGEQNRRQRGHSAASRSFWFRDTLTSRNVQTSKGRWRGSCRSPWESSGRRQDPERDDRGGSPGYGAPPTPTDCCPLGLSGCLLATLGSPSMFLLGGQVQLQPLASSPAPACCPLPTRMANTPLPPPATWPREKNEHRPQAGPSPWNTVPAAPLLWG